MAPTTDITQDRRCLLLLLRQDEMDRQRFTILHPLGRELHRAAPMVHGRVSVISSQRHDSRWRFGDAVQHADPALTETVQARFPVVNLGVIGLELQRTAQRRLVRRVLGRKRRESREGVPALDDERLPDLSESAQPCREDQRLHVVGLPLQIVGQLGRRLGHVSLNLSLSAINRLARLECLSAVHHQGDAINQ